MPEDYQVDPLFEEIAEDLLYAQQACEGARLVLQRLNLPQYIGDKDPLYIRRTMRNGLSRMRSAVRKYPSALRKYKKQQGV